MANSAGVCVSFKGEVMSGIHALGTTVVRGATTADTAKAALYFASATINNTTTAYTATGEGTGTGYTAGGITVTNATAPTTNSTSGVWTPSASLVWAGLTMAAFDTVLLYNSTQSNRAIEVCTFGSQTITAGTLTLTMPANTAGNALIQLA